MEIQKIEPELAKRFTPNSKKNQKGENNARVYFDWTEPPLRVLHEETFNEED